MVTDIDVFGVGKENISEKHGNFLADLSFLAIVLQ
jgi:hypothetical protein